MPWPKATDYNEAVQNLRLSLYDEELRAGEAARTSLGLPMLWSGNFAQVYKIHCPATGNTWALKCFTREVPGLQQRYRTIAAHLDQVRLPFTVDFQYLEQGIRIAGGWFPVLKMRWVEGLTLNQFVEKHLKRPKNLSMLLDLWVKLAARLREAEVTHADLQHGNVLLVPMPRGQLALRLIDYDGMYVPALAASGSGEVGHPAYQHPQRLREGTYNAEVDRFSHLAIYTAIRCLMVRQGDLWQRFNNGDNLLFRESDFRQPNASEVFRTLWGLRNANARALVGRLILACQQPLEQAPLLHEIMTDGKALPLSRQEQSAVESLLTGEKPPILAALAEQPPVLPQPPQAPVSPPLPPAEQAGEVIRQLLEQAAVSPKFALPRRRSVAWRLASSLRRVPAAIGWFDRLLAALVGKENVILHNFLRVFVGFAAALGLVLLLGFAAKTGLPAAGSFIASLVKVLQSPSPVAPPEPPKSLHLEPIAVQTVEVGKPLVLAVMVGDIQRWEGKLQFRLASNAPSGARIDPDTGWFTWTPSENQLPGTYDVAVSVETSDGQKDQTTFKIAVTSSIVRPPIPPKPLRLRPIPAQTVEAGKPLVVRVGVEDAGQWAGKVRFSLGSYAPSGARIDSQTGMFTWTPPLTSAPRTDYGITVSVDSPDGQKDQASFTITVTSSIFRPPIPPKPLHLQPIPAQTIEAGKPLVVAVSVADAGQWAGKLRFSLGPRAPSGARIDPQTGTFTWTPAEGSRRGKSFSSITVLVDGPDGQKDHRTFRVTVTPPPLDKDPIALRFDAMEKAVGHNPLKGQLTKEEFIKIMKPPAPVLGKSEPSFNRLAEDAFNRITKADPNKLTKNEYVAYIKKMMTPPRGMPGVKKSGK